MTTYQPGQTATFEDVLTADASVITVTILDVDGDTLIGPTSSGISHAGTGLYLYAWAIPADQASGTLTVKWAATVAGQPVNTSESFTVSPSGVAGTWCAVADVLAFTGGVVEQIDVDVAQQLMEALIHRVWRVTDVTRRDYYWLTRATAWQALYVNARPEIKTMMDVQSISQDGISVSFKGSTQSLALYSPVALRFLSSLFRGSNSTIRLNSAFQKNRLTKVGITAGSTVPWSNL